jgi:hypothetical protein
MPADPTLPTNIAAGGTTTGHKAHTDTLHSVVNGAYRAILPTAKTADFTLAQSDSGEVIRVNSSSSVAVTVPSLAVGTVVELVRMGTGAVTLTASGTTLRYPSGATPSPRLQYSSIALLWLTTTEVLVSGDLA